jgi:hypothetical protein
MNYEYGSVPHPSKMEAESDHLATINWNRGKWADFAGKYAREHEWQFAGGAKLNASESPFLTPEGYRDISKLDPGETVCCDDCELAHVHLARHSLGRRSPTHSADSLPVGHYFAVPRTYSRSCNG